MHNTLAATALIDAAGLNMLAFFTLPQGLSAMDPSSLHPSLFIRNLMNQLGEHDDLLALLYRCIDRAAIEYALERHEHNQTKAAKYLGISRTTLQKKIHLLGLSRAE